MKLNVLIAYTSIKEASDKENIILSRMQRLVRANTIVNDVLYSKTTNPDIKNSQKEGWSFNAKKVFKVDKDGNILKTFRTFTDAATDEKIPRSTLTRWMKTNKLINGIQYKYL